MTVGWKLEVFPGRSFSSQVEKLRSGAQDQITEFVQSLGPWWSIYFFLRTDSIPKPFNWKLSFCSPGQLWGSRRQDLKSEKALICPGSFSLRLYFCHLTARKATAFQIFIPNLCSSPICTLISLWFSQTHPHLFLASLALSPCLSSWDFDGLPSPFYSLVWYPVPQQTWLPSGLNELPLEQPWHIHLPQS